MLTMDIIETASTADKMFELKYGEQFESLKKNFISFYNLTDQISALYISILDASKQLEVLDDSENQEQWQTLKHVINSSLITLKKISQNSTINLDFGYCEKFTKTFQANLNILCSYYHSLSHIEVIGGKMKFEKKKIVEGINKLFRLHSEIKTEYRNNFNQLKNISKFRQFLIGNIKQFVAKKQVLKTKEKTFNSFEDSAVEFYPTTIKTLEEISESTESSVGMLMKSYFKITHQFYQTQSELQVYLRPLHAFCEDLKEKKRGPTNYGIADAVNNFTRISSQLLKPNITMKNFKKLKVQEYQKTLTVLLNQLAQNKMINANVTGQNIFTDMILSKAFISFQNQSNNQNQKSIPIEISQKIDEFIEEIIEISSFLIDCTKQLQKIQNSGLLGIVQQYKDKMTSQSSDHHPNSQQSAHKKFILKLGDYQKYMSEYYLLHEEIKQFQRVVQEFMLVEFGLKINVQISILDDLRTLQ